MKKIMGVSFFRSFKMESPKGAGDSKETPIITRHPKRNEKKKSKKKGLSNNYVSTR